MTYGFLHVFEITTSLAIYVHNTNWTPPQHTGKCIIARVSIACSRLIVNYRSFYLGPFVTSPRNFLSNPSPSHTHTSLLPWTVWQLIYSTIIYIYCKLPNTHLGPTCDQPRNVWSFYLGPFVTSPVDFSSKHTHRYYIGQCATYIYI